MSTLQRLLAAILPRTLMQNMETESRSWIARCPDCSHERSVWDLGGIRFGAAGKPRWRLTCRQCGKSGWHEVSRAKQ